jgi:hypothetical protein
VETSRARHADQLNSDAAAARVCDGFTRHEVVTEREQHTVEHWDAHQVEGVRLDLVAEVVGSHFIKDTEYGHALDFGQKAGVSPRDIELDAGDTLGKRFTKQANTRTPRVSSEGCCEAVAVDAEAVDRLKGSAAACEVLLEYDLCA